MKPTGYKLWSNGTVMAIATMRSKNRKTGNLIQTWIMREDMPPIEAARTGKNRATCGNCPIKQACYVNLGQTPTIVYRAAKQGKFPSGMPDVTRRKIRLGAYGDPAFIPFGVWEELTALSLGWVGYTHQWRSPRHQDLKRRCMASVESRADAMEAQRNGWRTFRIVRNMHDDLIKGEMFCLNYTKGLTCEECMLCSGTMPGIKGVSIAIPAHGTNKNKLKLKL